jgi:hypothetical protein
MWYTPVIPAIQEALSSNTSIAKEKKILLEFELEDSHLLGRCSNT